MTSTDTTFSLHYFRLPRHLWELSLARISQMGVDSIFTPVPWGFHQPVEDSFDISASTSARRDLKGFVELCDAMGLQLILDLSPQAQAESALLFNGLPGWLFAKYPELRALDKTGQPVNRPSLSHPTLLKLVESWYTYLSKNISQTEKVTLQLSLPANTLDYNEQVIKVQWPIWLRKQYAAGGVEALNTAYAPAEPFTSISQVSLTEPPNSATFEQDLQSFISQLNQEVQQDYQRFLEAGGFSLSEAISPPPHAIQIKPDFAEVGQSFQWATTAPLLADGTPAHSFWQGKTENFATIAATEIIFKNDDSPTFALPANSSCYRLLLNGDVTAVKVTAGETTAPYIALDENGETDFYFALPNPETVFDSYLARYLNALFASQQRTLQYCLKHIEQLLEAFNRPTPAATTLPTSPATPTLSEAQSALSEANLALAKASASIGGLEQAFATALNKPQEMATPETLFIIDPSQLGPVQESCQTVAVALKKGAEQTLPNPFTLENYQTAFIESTQAATYVIDELSDSLLWLREQLAVANISATAWAVHARLEHICQSLSAGVLRA